MTVLYFRDMDKDTKDILEAVNFIKDRMATKHDIAARSEKIRDTVKLGACPDYLGCEA